MRPQVSHGGSFTGREDHREGRRPERELVAGKPGLGLGDTTSHSLAAQGLRALTDMPGPLAEAGSADRLELHPQQPSRLTGMVHHPIITKWRERSPGGKPGPSGSADNK